MADLDRKLGSARFNVDQLQVDRDAFFALAMAIAIDGCGNALFGGKPDVTISERTGNGLVEGAVWAKCVAPIIDFVFGKNHFINTAEKSW